MAEILGIPKLKQVLKQLEAHAKHKGGYGVSVGYTAQYALYVHEMTPKHAGEKRKGYHAPGKKKGGQKKRGRYWDPQGRAGPKFLESPFREMQAELIMIVKKAVAAGATLIEGLRIAGLRLQRESQLRVPVDSGNLKGSAFTRAE